MMYKKKSDAEPVFRVLKVRKKQYKLPHWNIKISAEHAATKAGQMWPIPDKNVELVRQVISESNMLLAKEAW